MKYTEDRELEVGCRKALAQIETRHYEEKRIDDGVEVILKYRIVCFKKSRRVMLEDAQG